jgi:outer membrane protein, heavy metal efflux system
VTVRPGRWLIAVACAQLACASAATKTGPDQIAEGITQRSGVDARGWPAREPGALPPGVVTADGLTMQEAVAAGLWNNPGFQVALADLGVARADAVDAGLLANPILSILFPWGPKQLETTASWAIDSLWRRPRRLRAAKLDVESVAARLVYDGLGTIATVRGLYVDAAAAARRAEIARETADAAARFGTVVEARLRGGEISERDAHAARGDRAIAEAAARAAEHDRELALIRLKGAVGLPQSASIALTPLGDLAIRDCGEQAALLRDALAARPDVRAAELAVEAAAARAGLARAQAVSLTAILDANAEGKAGFEAGPGLSGELPIFSQNTGGRARAAAALRQAQARYLAARARVDEDVHLAHASLARAKDLAALWEGDALRSIGVEQRQAMLAYEAGELQVFAVLDANRRAGAIRIGALDARRDLLSAAIALDRAIGRSCTIK